RAVARPGILRRGFPAQSQPQAGEVQLLMRGFAKGEWVSGNDFGCQRTQPRNRRPRFVEPSHMRVASGEKTIGRGECRQVFDSNLESWDRLFETPAEEQRRTDQPGTILRERARAEPN